MGFGRAWDPPPMHAGPEAAEAPPFGGLIASGTHLVALPVRLLVDHPRRAAAIAGPGWDRVRIIEPALEGVTLALTRDCPEAGPFRSGAEGAWSATGSSLPPSTAWGAWNAWTPFS